MPCAWSKLHETWFAKVVVKEFKLASKSPDLNPNYHPWDELEHWLHARSFQSTSVLNLTNGLVVEWAQIPAATLLNIVESHPKREKAVLAWKKVSALCKCPWFQNEMFTKCPCDGQVSLYFWSQCLSTLFTKAAKRCKIPFVNSSIHDL